MIRMTKMTPVQEAAYALDYEVDRESLSPAAQAEYDRLKQERASRPRAQTTTFTDPGANSPAGRPALTPEPAREGEPVSGGHLPLNIAGRSPVDGIRLRWAAIGNLILGLGCIFGAGGGGGIFFGIVFLALGVATIYLTRFGAVPWHNIPKNVKPVVAAGSAIGLAWLCIFFFWLFILWVAFKTVLKWMAE
jgi:hypothetical protein